MIQEDKELLLKDLCARIPYHVRVKIWLKDGTTEEGSLDLQHNYADVLLGAFYYNKIIDIKPYLRPLSSMTDSEKEYYYGLTEMKCTLGYAIDKVRFCLEYHIDMNNLIPKGLALEAPEGMYNV